MDVIQTISLVAAAISVGLMAGAFFIFSVAVMPGLARTDDRTFVGAFQAIDRAIINPLFLSVFLGGLGFPGLAVALHLGEGGGAVLPGAAGAFLLYLVVFLITVRVNVPLNDALKAAGDPDRIADPAAVRARFNEARWVRFNAARTILSLLAFGALIGALVG